MIFYGRRATKTGTMGIKNTKCDSCEETSTQVVSTFGKYFHVYWIPFFPMGREVVAECENCLKTIPYKEFTPQLKDKYDLNRHLVKTPKKHWAGLAIIGLLIGSFFIADMTREVNQYEDDLDADIALMVTDPTAETDSTSAKIKTLFGIFLSEEMKPDKIKYYTKTKGNKMLILTKISELSNVESSERAQVFEWVEKMVDISDGKELYIGVQGYSSMIMAKTPRGIVTGSSSSRDDLYHFYESDVGLHE